MIDRYVFGMSNQIVPKVVVGTVWAARSVVLTVSTIEPAPETDLQRMPRRREPGNPLHVGIEKLQKIEPGAVKETTLCERESDAAS